MSNTIIPEIVRREVKSQDSNHILNIKLKKVENNQTYNKFDNSKTITNTTTITNNSKGFFHFIFSIIFFPFILIYKFFRFIIIKGDFAGNYEEYKKRNNNIRRRKNMLKKASKMYKFNDEIF